MATFMAFAVISCEKPEVPGTGGQEQPEQEQPEQEEPEKPENAELGDNAYELDGERYEFASVQLSNIGDYICIAATPSEGVANFDEVFDQDEYLYIAISPLLNGKEFNLVSEERVFTLISTLDGAYVETVAPSLTDEILSGTCVFNCVEGVADVEVSIVLADGTELRAKMSAEEQGIVVNENIFAIGGNEKPVRTAFRMLEDGTTALYLTPAGIEYFEDISITTYYAYVILDDSRCHGRTLAPSDVIAVGYADNFNDLIVDSREVPVTGTLNIAADLDDPAHYVVSMDLDFAGTSLKIRFDGQMLDASAVEVVENKVVYNGESLGINKVSVNMQPNPKSTYAVMVHTDRDDGVSITFPSDFLDGNAHGFSQSQNLYIEYDGKVYSKATGSSGTVTIGVRDNIIKIEVTNYANLEVIYEGPYVEVL